MVKTLPEAQRTFLGDVGTYKSGLSFFVRAPEVPFLGTSRWTLLAKVPIFGYGKMALRVSGRKN